MARRKAEAVTLHCSHCTWGTELPLAETEQSCVIQCAHCGSAIYWHRCEQCGLCYAGGEAPSCPICDDTSLDKLS